MSKEKYHGVGKFIIGACVGAGLGLLFAPKSGSETRKELKNKLTEFLNQVKNLKFEDVKKEFNLKVKEIREGLDDLDKEKVMEFAKEKGNALKGKAQELVELAKEKGTPALKKSADSILTKVIKVSQDAQKRLGE